MFRKATLISAAALAVMVFTGCSDEPDNKNSNQSTISVSSDDGELTKIEGSEEVKSQDEAIKLFNDLFDAASDAIEDGVNKTGLIDGGASETTGGTTEIGQIRSTPDYTKSYDTTFTINGLSGSIDFTANGNYADYGKYDITKGSGKATFFDYSADDKLFIGGSIGLTLNLRDNYKAVVVDGYEDYDYLSSTGSVALAVALKFTSNDFNGTLGFEAAAAINTEVDPGYTITKATATVDGYTIPQDIVKSKLDSFIETFDNGSESTSETIEIN